MKTPQKHNIKTSPVRSPRGGIFLRPIPPAWWVFILASGLSLYDLFWAFIPLIFFVILCFVAVFFPGWQFFFHTVMHGSRSRNRVSLTFDDGPDQETTPALLALLDKHNVKAAFFIVGNKAARYPELISEILSRGHELGNHSLNHDVFLMLRTSATLRHEIEGCSQALEASGIRALAFRPPVGIVSPRLKPVLERLGMFCVGFSVRGGDWGNRKISGLSERILSRVRPGDIVLLHDCRPAGREISEWRGEVEAVITGLKRKKIEPAKLSELLGREIMIIPRRQGK